MTIVCVVRNGSRPRAALSAVRDRGGSRRPRAASRRTWAARAGWTGIQGREAC